MEVKIYKMAGIVAMEKNGRWGLFGCEGNDEKTELVPLEFAQNLSSLKVYEHNNLIITPDTVCTLQGQVLLHHNGDAEVVKLPSKILIFAKDKKYGIQLIIWNGRKVLLQESCSGFRYSQKYLALQYRQVWSLFKIDGTPIDEAAFSAEDVEIHSEFLIAKHLCKEDLYSIKKRAVIKKEQTKILCSDNLVLCAKVGESSLSVYDGIRWTRIPNADEFNMINGVDHLFYVKRKDKYFLYDGIRRFMKSEYPDGVDFVGYDKEMLMIVNNGEPVFYNRE